MILVPSHPSHLSHARVWLAAGVNTLAAQAEKVLELDRCSRLMSHRINRLRSNFGQLFVFRGRRGDLLKIFCWDAQGACLFSKRLEKDRFVWKIGLCGLLRRTAKSV